MKQIIATSLCLLLLGILVALRISGRFVDPVLEFVMGSISILVIFTSLLKLLNFKKQIQLKRYWLYFLLESVRLVVAIVMILNFTLFIITDHFPLLVRIGVGSGIPMMIYLFVQTSRRLFKSWCSYKQGGKIEVDEKYL